MKNVEWSVNENIKLANKIIFYFENTKKHIIMTEQDETSFKSKKTCQICEKIFNLIKLEIIVKFRQI